MDEFPVRLRLLESFDRMPKQAMAAARWVLDNPEDVALLTMREQAKRAGVAPVTMTRLAQRLGFNGYDAVRQAHADSLRRGGGTGFVDKAEALVALRKLRGDAALALDLIETLTQRIAGLRAPETLDALATAVSLLTKARRIYALGYRSSYPVAFHFAYISGLAGGKVHLLDTPGGTGIDALRDAGSDDALVAVTVKPYTRAAVEVAEFATGRGVELVAITDSPVSPLVSCAGASILVSTESPSFFHTMAPAFAVAEALAALLAAGSGDRALDAVRRMEAQFDSLGTHVLPHTVSKGAV